LNRRKKLKSKDHTDKTDDVPGPRQSSLPISVDGSQRGIFQAFWRQQIASRIYSVIEIKFSVFFKSGPENIAGMLTNPFAQAVVCILSHAPDHKRETPRDMTETTNTPVKPKTGYSNLELILCPRS
jgi:hypothetical protein